MEDVTCITIKHVFLWYGVQHPELIMFRLPFSEIYPTSEIKS